MTTIPTDGARAARAAIQHLEAERIQRAGEINAIAKALISDFHFLDYEVSTFWTCDASPIGMCVWEIRLDSSMYALPKDYWNCRYCGGPVERK